MGFFKGLMAALDLVLCVYWSVYGILVATGHTEPSKIVVVCLCIIASLDMLGNACRIAADSL